MADDEQLSPSPSPPSKSKALSSLPIISLPPRTSMESLFSGGPGFGFGFSPGPMTLVSSFFSDNEDCRSFSQLLAGAMASPATVPPPRPTASELNGSIVGDGFRQNRPTGLTITQPPLLFSVPPGLSPPGLLDSPGIFSPGQGPFGMTHQQALATVTMQAAEAYSQKQIEAESSTSSVAPATSSTEFSVIIGEETADQQMPPPLPNSAVAAMESSGISQMAERLQPSSCGIDKPADDGYNWRKYGQKHVKGSEFPRSYYKCTQPNCPVKKKVERSLEGQVTEIIYKGEHNHERPRSNKRAKGIGNPNGYSSIHENAELYSRVQSGYANKSNEQTALCSLAKKDRDSSHLTHEHLSGTSDSEGVSEIETGVNQNDDDEPDPKRRNTEVRVSEPASSHRMLTESRIVVQTTSEVDLLDDGYRWRKYGQKIVKGNPYPRSYYKCTTPGCNVRKHVERASTDPKAVITTYEGKHNHDVPAGRNSSHSTIIKNVSRLKSQNMATGNSEQQPVGLLLLKEEQTA